jgi:hypothetical protein
MMKWGTFVNVPSGEQTEPPAPDAAFPILCGGWPNEHEEAIQRMCSCCTTAVGVSPRGIAYHDAKPEIRPLMCKCCFALLAAITSKDKPDDVMALLVKLAKAEKPDGY